MSQKTFEELLRGYFNDNLSQEELSDFLQLIRKSEYSVGLKQTIELLLQDSSLSGLSDPSRADAIFANIMDWSPEKEKEPKTKLLYTNNESRIFSFIKVAAAVLIALSAVLYLFLSRADESKIANKVSPENNYKNDILPNAEKAILTLADGTTILLEDAQNGVLTPQGNAKIMKRDGKLTYSASNAPAGEVLYNTISTPRGKQYQIELADGSRIWLNAGSSLRYPTSFTQKERRIEMTGEAYFEIAKNKDQPFVVKVNNSEIRVLGTHFNVMAYQDEDVLKTTLLEGSVQFTNGDALNILKPGQQSQLIRDGKVKVVSGIDVQNAVAWKNGYFNFEGADIESVMRQLSRWYDIEVTYGKKIDERFYAEIPCAIKLSEALKALELTGKVRFAVEGKKVMVMQ